MKPHLLVLLLLAACGSPYQQAQKITAPISKKIAKAQQVSLRIGRVADRQEKLIAEQSGSAGRAKGSTEQAMAIAERLNAMQPSADTKALVLALQVVKKEVGGIELSNHGLKATTVEIKANKQELDLIHEQAQTAVVKATGKVAVQIEKKEKAEGRAHFWMLVTFGLVAAITALFYFKAYLKTVPFIGPILSRLLP